MTNDTRAGGSAVPLAGIVLSAVLLIGTVLTIFVAARYDDPEAYGWAPQLADRRLGIALTCAMLVTCAAAAGAIRLSAAKRLRPARALLGLVLLSGIAATVMRVLECPIAARYAGVSLRSVEAPVGRGRPSPGGRAAPALPLLPASPDRGKPVFMRTCAACHGPDGGGVKGQGASLRDSAFVRGKTDDQLLAFVKVGRQPFDPETRLHLTMPARGGNPSLTDQNLLDAVAVVRTIQLAAEQEAQHPVPAAVAAAAPPKADSGDQPRMIDGALWYPHSILSPAGVGPSGTSAAVVRLQKPGASGRSAANVQLFFSVALFVGGLHGMYLAIGLISGLAIVAARSSSWRMLQLIGIYWLVIGMLGLVTLPVFYL